MAKSIAKISDTIYKSGNNANPSGFRNEKLLAGTRKVLTDARKYRAPVASRVLSPVKDYKRITSVRSM